MDLTIGNICATPTQAVEALRAKGGLQNSCVHLYEINRTRLFEIEFTCAVLERKLKPKLPRKNEIVFTYSKAIGQAIGSENFEDNFSLIPSLTITTFQHSGKHDWWSYLIPITVKIKVQFLI